MEGFARRAALCIARRMRRVAAILMMFVLLLNGRHPMRSPPPGARAMTVTAQAIPLDRDRPDRRHLGELEYLGGWALTGSTGEFGGISSMSVDEDGHVIALSDGSGILTFTAGQRRSPGIFRPLPILPAEKGAPRSRFDTESMARDPVSGTIWVGFEGDARICRYSAGFARIEGCVSPAAMQDWPYKTGIESLARLPDGRFLAIAEDAPGPQGMDHDVLLFAGDPVDPATPPPMRLSYAAPVGYLPTDAVAIDNDRLLVLNRRVTLMDLFTGVLVLVDIRHMGPGTLLRGREVARLAPPVQNDNFEALAISRENGLPVLWVASDDNRLFFQRNLLLRFAMPGHWFANEGESGV